MDYKRCIMEMLDKLDERRLKLAWLFIHGMLKKH